MYCWYFDHDNHGLNIIHIAWFFMVLHSPNIPMLSKNMYIIYKQRFAFTSTYLPYFLYTNNLPVNYL